MAVQRYYNEVYAAHELDQDERGNAFGKVEPLWSSVPVGTTLDVLDIGCGAGAVTAVLVTAGHRVVGLDIMTEAVNRAKDRGLDARVHDLNDALPFDDASFDRVIALDILEHVFDPLALLSEIRRVLRPNGFAIIMIPLHFDVRQRVRSALGRGIVHYEHLFYDPTCSAWNYFHIRFFRLEDIYVGLARAHLRVERKQFRPMALPNRPGLLGKVEDVLRWRTVVRTWPSLFASGVLLRVLVSSSNSD